MSEFRAKNRFNGRLWLCAVGMMLLAMTICIGGCQAVEDTGKFVSDIGGTIFGNNESLDLDQPLATHRHPLKVIELDEQTTQHKLCTPLAHHYPQETLTTCAAASLRSYYGLTGRTDVPGEADLMDRHRRTLADYVPGRGGLVDLVRTMMSTRGEENSEQYVLQTWEIEDGILHGHEPYLFQEMRNREILIVDGADLGIGNARRMSIEAIADSIKTHHLPVIVSLAVRDDIRNELTDQNHAMVVVAVTEQGENVISLGLLDPMIPNRIVEIDVEDFRTRLRYAANEIEVYNSHKRKLAWADRYELRPGAHLYITCLVPPVSLLIDESKPSPRRGGSPFRGFVDGIQSVGEGVRGVFRNN